eukprot:Pgem_evm1s18955
MAFQNKFINKSVTNRNSGNEFFKKARTEGLAPTIFDYNIERAICHYKNAIDFASNRPEDRASAYKNMAACYTLIFKVPFPVYSNKLDDIDYVKKYRDAVGLSLLYSQKAYIDGESAKKTSEWKYDILYKAKDLVNVFIEMFDTIDYEDNEGKCKFLHSLCLTEIKGHGTNLHAKRVSILDQVNCNICNLNDHDAESNQDTAFCILCQCYLRLDFYLVKELFMTGLFCYQNKDYNEATSHFRDGLSHLKQCLKVIDKVDRQTFNNKINNQENYANFVSYNRLGEDLKYLKTFAKTVNWYLYGAPVLNDAIFFTDIQAVGQKKTKVIDFRTLDHFFILKEFLYLIQFLLQDSKHMEELIRIENEIDNFSFTLILSEPQRDQLTMVLDNLNHKVLVDLGTSNKANSDANTNANVNQHHHGANASEFVQAFYAYLKGECYVLLKNKEKQDFWFSKCIFFCEKLTEVKEEDWFLKVDSIVSKRQEEQQKEERERQKAEQEQQEQQRREQEKLERERLERERLDRIKKAEQEKLEKERQKQERQKQEKERKEREAKNKADKEREEQLEKERLIKHKKICLEQAQSEILFIQNLNKTKGLNECLVFILDKYVPIKSKSETSKILKIIKQSPTTRNSRILKQVLRIYHPDKHLKKINKDFYIYEAITKIVNMKNK